MVLTFFNSLFLASFPVEGGEEMTIFISNQQQQYPADQFMIELAPVCYQHLLAWSVGFINFPLLVEEVERRPIVTVGLLHAAM